MMTTIAIANLIHSLANDEPKLKLDFDGFVFSQVDEDTNNVEYSLPRFRENWWGGIEFKHDFSGKEINVEPELNYSIDSFDKSKTSLKLSPNRNPIVRVRYSYFAKVNSGSVQYKLGTPLIIDERSKKVIQSETLKSKLDRSKKSIEASTAFSKIGEFTSELSLDRSEGLLTLENFSILGVSRPTLVQFKLRIDSLEFVKKTD